MDQAEDKSMNKTQTTVRRFLEFFAGFLGSVVAGNLALILFAQFDPQRIWTPYFKWFWILVLAVLAGLFFTRKRTWISFGVAAAAILMVF
jgi:hypothetical protein